MNSNKAEFLAKLKALMQEHNVVIAFSVDDISETSGLWGETMLIEGIGDNDKWTHEVEGWEINADNLIEEEDEDFYFDDDDF